MVSRREWYERANACWPTEVPPLSADEAVRAAKKIYRFVSGRKLTIPVEITSGNRYSYPHDGILYVNPTSIHHGGGWKALVHDLSHWLDPGRAHSKEHARLEMRIVKMIVRRGWLSGALKDRPAAAKPEPTAAEIRLAKLRAIEAKLKRWETKQKRARTAIAKLTRSRRGLERALAAQPD